MADSISLNGIPGIDAITLADWVASHPDGNAPLDWVNEANRFVTAVGFSPGRGSILLPVDALDALDLTRKLSLRIADQDGNFVELPNLRAAGNPRCLTAGSSAPVYQVYLTDRRVDLVGTTNLRFQWRYQPWDNVEAESTYGPLQGFGSGSRGATDIGTYELVCRELWTLLADDLGPWPGLPSTVPYRTKRTVDRLDLHGWRIVDALEDCLAAVGCAVAYDVRKDTFSVVYFPRATDAAVELFTKYRGQLDYDESPYVPKKFGPIPSQVSVLFPVWQGGRTGTNQRGYKSVSWTATLINSGNGVSAHANNTPFSQPSEMTEGTVYLQDFTPSRHYENGSRLDTNQVSQAIADVPVDNRSFQVAAIFYDRLRQGSPQMPFKRSYRGVLTDDRLAPGGTFDVVGWGIVGSGAKTFVARSGLVGSFEIYEELPQSGGTLASGNSGYSLGMPRTPARHIDGSVKRAGGYYPDLDRDNNSFGWGGVDEGQTTVAGWALGPLYRRGSALRQGDWISVGSGGRTDQRSRLWRNWQDMGPHDMTRFVEVTSDTRTTISIPRRSPTGGTVTSDNVGAYPAKVLMQMGVPDVWDNFDAFETHGWVLEANEQNLKSGRKYLAHQGNIADDGLPVWATEYIDDLTYDSWYLTSGVEQSYSVSGPTAYLENWSNPNTLATSTLPYFPSNGWYLLFIDWSARIISYPTSSAAANAVYMNGYVQGIVNKIIFFAPLGITSGITTTLASAHAANASGLYRDINTWSATYLVKVDGVDNAERSLYLNCNAFGFDVTLSGTDDVKMTTFGASGSFFASSGVTAVGMKKLRDL